MASRSIRISWRAPGRTMARPALSRPRSARWPASRRPDRRRPRRSASAARILRREARIARSASMSRKAASSQATVGAPMAPAPDRRRGRGVAGIADGIARSGGCRRRAWCEIEVSPPPGTKAAAEAEGVQEPAPARRRAPAADDATARSSARGDETPERQPALRGRDERDRRRPWNGARAKCGSGMQGTRTCVAHRLEVEPVIVEIARHGPCGDCATCAARRPWPRQSKATTAKPRASSSATISKYFSMNSARPCRMQTVPRGPLRPASRRRAGCSRRVVVTGDQQRLAGDRVVGGADGAARRDLQSPSTIRPLAYARGHSSDPFSRSGARRRSPLTRHSASHLPMCRP